MELIDREFVRRALPARPADGHKGTFGKVCLLGGSVGYTGAPVLCAGAAVRSGCGLVYLGVPECVWHIAAAKCLCAMPFPLPEKDGALALSGEADFRRREAEVLRRVGRESGTVVATGGGAILREDNVRALRQNGRVCFLRRALEQLPTDGRPLSGPDDAIARLWRERREKYERCADFTVDNNSSAEAVARRIQEGFHEAAHR